MSGQHPDSELIALCARFDELERETTAVIRRYGRDDAAIDAAREPLQAEQEQLLAQITALHPVTLQGHQARARTVWFCFGDSLRGGGWDEQMLRSLVMDLAAESAP